MRGVFEGYGQDFISVQLGTPDYDKLTHLERNVYQFSGAKNYQQLRDLTSALRDGDRVLSFNEFRAKAITILDEYQGAWLRTEYNAAIAGSQMAAKWVDFEKHPGALLEYRTMEDTRVRPEHALLDKIRRYVTDAFWRSYYPPNGWNCRCTVIRLNDGDETPDNELQHPDIPGIFRVNLGKEGLCFPQKSPYFIGCPPSVLKAADTVLLKEQQRTAIDRLVGKVEVKRPELAAPITFSKRGIKEAFNQPHAQYYEKNSILRRIDDVLYTATYMGITPYPADNPMVMGSHIFRFIMGGKSSYAIVHQHIDGMLRFYSISDSKKVLKGIKK